MKNNRTKRITTVISYLWLLLFLTVVPSHASHLSLRMVKQPVYLLETESEATIQIIDVPFVTLGSDPEWRFAAIGMPFIPSGDESWKNHHDINLASLYGITLAGTYKKGTFDIKIIIDASQAKVPPAYPFTMDQVINAVVTCVKLMYPPKPEKNGTMDIIIVR